MQTKMLWWLAALSLAGTARAAGDGACPTREERPPMVNFRVDNDLFGGQDQGYTNGAQLGFVSPNLSDYTDDPCLPALARWLNRPFGFLQPEGFPQKNMVVTFAQGLFTPEDSTRRDLIREDRPYAALLLASMGYNGRDEDRLHTTQLQFGMLGPSAQGRQTQDLVHKITGSKKFEGWHNQLHDEPVFRLIHERMHRYPGASEGNWNWDAITHWGGTLGTISTYANAGAEFRFGKSLPDDFGSTPLRPAGENTAPTGSRGQLHGYHLFFTFDARAVARDITLDGNTFRDSHSVDKKHFVGEAGYGVAWFSGRWKFAVARYHRTREFDGQRERPVFGSFTITRML